MAYSAVFIICEFDPFHFGHKFLIDEAKKISGSAPVICIMSGNFTQRGECAVADKFTRAKSAVLCGADLVLLLPVFYSSACAELFARGAVRIISEVSCGDECALIFGSESGDVNTLIKCADNLDTEEFKNKMENVRANEQFAKSREEIYGELFGDASVLSTPNNILGIEYIRAIKKYAPNVVPHTVKREGAVHNSDKTERVYASATYLRKTSETPEFYRFIPEITHGIYKNDQFPARIQNAEKLILAKLRQTKRFDFADGEGGLLQRIVKSSQNAVNYDELISSASTKRYTNARIRRCLLSAFLEITEEQRQKAPTFTQLLAANTVGIKFLSDTKKRHRSIEIITKPSKHTDLIDFKREIECDNMFAFMMPKTAPFNYSLKNTPFILK